MPKPDTCPRCRQGKAPRRPKPHRVIQIGSAASQFGLARKRERENREDPTMHRLSECRRLASGIVPDGRRFTAETFFECARHGTPCLLFTPCPICIEERMPLCRMHHRQLHQIGPAKFQGLHVVCFRERITEFNEWYQREKAA
jgi:hypothetical protein